ncbi:MAG: regulatory iron-sulfur-containing complex subunit RicT [Phycisphaerales bacterium]|nr:regulatory iron-sulfur-containing complex subunit RicT [Phycisphaerales bacterium]
MPILPLPVFEEDVDPANRDALTLEEQLAEVEEPKTIAVRFGRMKMVGEYKNAIGVIPGCGSKLVVRTHRGVELTEVITTTCENAGCGKSVTRKEMLGYIENSGGREYPFYTRGRILRVATTEDLSDQTALQGDLPRYEQVFRELVAFYNLDMKFVAAEPILGGEMVTFYYMAENRIDFRELVRDLAAEFTARVEMRQVGARDEARLVADYERCGQHCCCKNFLKVLQPVSMRSAKVQKATLDPLKISGRCGRLMCCLRYEDQTYKELKKNLPHRKTRVGTSEGPGIVVDSKILTQLVLVKLEYDNREVAIPLEELIDPDTCPSRKEVESKRMAAMQVLPELEPPPKKKRSRSSRKGEKGGEKGGDESEGKGRKRRRRRRGRKGAETGTADAGSKPAPSAQADGAGSSGGTGRKKRRRRRRRGGRGSEGGGSGASGKGGS